MKKTAFATILTFLWASAAFSQNPVQHEKLLKAAGIATDGPGLLEYFSKQTGLVPQKEPPVRIIAAARLVVERKPPDASTVLWTYFPFCENAAVEKEVLSAALFLENGDGKRAVPALVKSLKHPVVVVRLRSASALTWLGWDAEGAVAGLAAALEDDAPEVRRQALYALDGIGPAAGEAAPVLIKLLNHEDEKIRQKVHQLLGRVGAGHKGVLIALQERLLDPNNKQQLWAAQALQEIGAESIPILLEALGRGPEKYSKSFSAQRLCWLAHGKLEVLPDLLAHFTQEDVGSWTAAGLPYFGPKAVPAVANFLDHPSLNVRIRAAKCLGQFGPFAKAALPKLHAALKDKEAAVRVQAAIALWPIERNTDATLPILLDVLKNDSDPFRPREICSILEQMEPLPKTGVAALLDILKNPGNRFHFEAIRALTIRDTEPKEVAPVLIDVLAKDKDFFPRAWAAKALRYLGPTPDVIQAQAKALSDPRLTVRIEAIKALASVGPKAKIVLPALMDALKDKYYGGDVALIIGKLGRDAKQAVPALIEALEKHPQKAATALGFIGTDAKEAIPHLARMLKNPVNQASMNALARIGAEAIPPLIEAMGDKNAQVSFQAAQTLGKMGPPAVASLLKVLDDPRKFRWGAAMSLGLIGPEAKSAVPALVKALGDKEGALKRGAARALGEIGVDSPAVIKALASVLDDRECAYEAMQSLARFGPKAKAALPALHAVLKKSKINLGAAEAIARIDPKAKAPLAVIALAIKDQKYRWVAVKDARRIGLAAKEIIDVLPEALDDKNHLVVQEAVGYLGEICLKNEDAVPVLMAAAGHRMHWVRPQALKAMGPMGAKATPAVPLLIRALGDRSDVLRQEAAKVLAQLGPAAKEAAPALRASLRRHDPLVRPYAAEALWKVAGPSDDVALALVAAFRSYELTNRGNWYIETRQKAAEVLAELGPFAKDALADLHAAAHDSGGFNTSHIDLRPQAAYALWKVGGETEDAVYSLMQSMKICQGPAKVNAARILGVIGPPGRLALPTLRLILRDANRGGPADAELRSAVAAAIKRIES